MGICLNSSECIASCSAKCRPRFSSTGGTFGARLPRPRCQTRLQKAKTLISRLNSHRRSFRKQMQHPRTHLTLHHDKTASRQKMDADTGASGEFQPRKGRLNYIEKGVRFFELEFDDEDHENGDGPLTVQTIVSSRIIGDVDSWAESDVW